jgi:hypothetical protein
VLPRAAHRDVSDCHAKSEAVRTPGCEGRDETAKLTGYGIPAQV